MEDNNKINLTIENYTGEKPIEVVYREGVAGKVLDQKAPEKIEIAGVLSTPLDWLEKRVDTINQAEAFILVERDKYAITLTINESDPYKKGTITGSAELSELFTKFGINNPNVGWTPAKLGQFIRLNRAAFEDKEICMKLVSALNNFKANAQSQIEKQHDPSGSRAEVYRQTVESNLPKSFTVKIPIFKGPEKPRLTWNLTTTSRTARCSYSLFLRVQRNSPTNIAIRPLTRCLTKSAGLPPTLP